ncbi:hypothetical protein OEZ85_013041 [Tetradesmus obliquus]|uniref:Nuclear control of ATPase protein 2 n=1 Tax=Tetradesmus obliquus TaxID=3088 RepID=A0ABY8U6R8_TETOB|nr:hypothetical protein OEZ85_013041 [Tetradesmus obliquus]
MDWHGLCSSLQHGLQAQLQSSSKQLRLALKSPLIWGSEQSLPVAGLDALSGQSVLYGLRNSLSEAPETIDAWLHALQLAQVASDRLLAALWDAQRNLKFWRSRLSAGSHGSFMLLERGPVGFVTDLLDAFKLQGSGVAASDRIEERIVALQLLSTQLAEVLAAVHNAAALLQLGSIDAAAAEAAAAAGRQPALQRAVHAAVSQCLAAIAAALQPLGQHSTQLQKQKSAGSRRLHKGGIYQTLASSIVYRASEQPAAAAAQQQAARSAGSASLQQLQQQLAAVQQLLGLQGDTLELLARSTRRGDAGSALAAASRLAAQQGSLVAVPAWALMPSSLQRHWIKASVAAALTLSAGVFLIKHSRLAGSTDLDDWVKAAAATAKGAWMEHVVDPMLAVKDELLDTFRSRPSIVSSSEFEADKESLLRMLSEFMRDHPEAPATAAAASPAAAANGSSSSSSSVPGNVESLLDSDAVNRGMAVVMACYENDLKRPIRSLVSGELARTLLIQVQRLKLDTEAAMLELDQILRANELSISLVAAIPGLLLSWGLVRGLWLLLLAPRPPDPRREALPCRLAMAELERALQQQLLQFGSCAAAEGLVLHKLARVFREARAVYRLKDSSSRYSEWPHLQADLLSLVAPGVPAASKLDLLTRMMRTYALLQP